MWVKNKNTGLIWEVDGELADRLSQSLDFEVVVENEEEKQEKTPSRKKSPGKNS
ncbi:hypothetical protein [Tepidibacillus fermentans]|uniref:hypothetical protein n=1 Tax=Tepidibacillus fermentans TaxID=1281767 RepID=UPI001404F58B|nr:hypothetical protein [Tepidibacillus fermentans]